jgi:hypothetical protein
VIAGSASGSNGVPSAGQRGGAPESARRLPEIVPLKWPMDTGKVAKYAVVIAGTEHGVPIIPR